MAAHESISQALFAAQEELLGLELIKNARNPHFKNSYVTLDALLDAVLPVLRKHDIMLLQPTYETATGDVGVKTILHHITTDTEVTSLFPLNKLQKDDPQGQGSAVTYARRYSLMSLFGLTADEDDDGNAASPRKKSSGGKRKASKKTEPKDEPVSADEEPFEEW